MLGADSLSCFVLFEAQGQLAKLTSVMLHVCLPRENMLTFSVLDMYLLGAFGCRVCR